MWEWAYSWARKQLWHDLPQVLSAAKVQRLSGQEEISVLVDGHECKLVLWNFAAEVTVPLDHAVLPDGLRVNESSLWGPRLQETWSSGEAVQTGDLEFDLAFVVLAVEVGALPQEEEVRRISPELRACLLELRSQLRDAELFTNRLRLPIQCSGVPSTPRPSVEKHRFRWALGRTFLDFDRMPSLADLQSGIERAINAAQVIERSSSAS